LILVLRAEHRLSAVRAGARHLRAPRLKAELSEGTSYGPAHPDQTITLFGGRASVSLLLTLDGLLDAAIDLLHLGAGVHVALAVLQERESHSGGQNSESTSAREYNLLGVQELAVGHQSDLQPSRGTLGGLARDLHLAAELLLQVR